MLLIFARTAHHSCVIMSNIHLNVTQNFDLPGLKNLSPCQFWGVPTHADVTEKSGYFF